MRDGGRFGSESRKSRSEHAQAAVAQKTDFDFQLVFVERFASPSPKTPAWDVENTVQLIAPRGALETNGGFV